MKNLLLTIAVLLLAVLTLTSCEANRRELVGANAAAINIETGEKVFCTVYRTADEVINVGDTVYMDAKHDVRLIASDIDATKVVVTEYHLLFN